jgi:hypothetical protein
VAEPKGNSGRELSTTPAFSAEAEAMNRVPTALRPSPTQEALRDVTLQRKEVKITDPRFERAFRRTLTFKGLAKPKGLSERLFDRGAAFKSHIATVASHLSEEWRRGLFEDIDYLLDVEAWPPDDVLPTLSSFQDYVRMVIYLRPLSLPVLGVANAGHIMAAWVDAEISLILEFPAPDQVWWSYSGTFQGAPERLAGQVPVRRLIRSLSGIDPKRWFAYEEARS